MTVNQQTLTANASGLLIGSLWDASASISDFWVGLPRGDIVRRRPVLPCANPLHAECDHVHVSHELPACV